MKKHTLIGLLLVLFALTAVLMLLPSCKGDKPASTTEPTQAQTTTAQVTTKATTTKATTTKATTTKATTTLRNPNGWDGTAATGFAVGDGSEANPYQIANEKELAYFAAQVNSGVTYDGKYFELTADLDLNDLAWPGIGVVPQAGTNANHLSADNWTQAIGFMGTFDGKNHTVSGLYMNEPSSYGVGFFRFLRCGAVKNLAVKGDVTGSAMVAGVAAIVCSGTAADPTTITGCFFEGTVGGLSGATNVGGLIGRLHQYSGSNKVDDATAGVVPSAACGYIADNYAKATFKGAIAAVTNTYLFGGQFKHNTHFTAERNYAVLGLESNSTFEAEMTAAVATDATTNPLGRGGCFQAEAITASEFDTAYTTFQNGPSPAPAE